MVKNNLGINKIVFTIFYHNMAIIMGNYYGGGQIKLLYLTRLIVTDKRYKVNISLY